METGVVVLHLVVVPRHDPRRGRVRGLELRVCMGRGVMTAEVVERHGRRQAVLAHAAGGQLVDVVAEKCDEPEIVPAHLLVRGVVAGLVRLAARDPERESVQPAARVGSSAGPPGRAHVIADAEPIEVVVPGVQAAHVGVHRVAEVRTGRPPARADHLGEPLVGGDLPSDGHLHRGHRLRRRRVHRQARPQHDRVGQRVTRCHAELKGIGGQRRCPAPATTEPAEQTPAAADRNTHPRQPTQEGAAADLPAHNVFPRA